ncbi:MAG: right-handed parallel beta-helix repeat-containing protein [Nitrospirae bacterium]|nr:right-handed parallel beta-helix repeat-containing protein [Nitrospirota bacterium]
MTGVSLNSNVTINWSENVDCTTVNTTNITMSAGGWALSSCSGSQAVFTTSGQNNSTTYRVTVSANVKEANGRPMPSGYEFSYTTTDGAANNAPALNWALSTACLTEGVRPRTGVINADFEFRVKYSDADNQCPSAITVAVNGTPYDLTSNDGASCATGRVYYRSIVIGSAGDLNYSFAASDGIDTATGTPTNNSTVSVMNTAYKVKPSGSSWSGSSWYTDLAAAYNAAPSSAVLLVYPNDNFASATYAGGLYNNGETDRILQSVCGAELTIISGGATVISLYANDGMVIDGFSITGGTTDGIYSNGDSFTVKNSKIYSNATGIRFSAANPVSIENSKIYDNTTLGVNSVNNTCLFSITDSEIYNNGSGAANGAAVSVTGGSTHTITRTSITGNTATGHGAAVYMNAGGITIEDSILSNNTANTGGAIYCMNCTLTIDDSTINDNTATSGGAINFVNASVNANITDTFIQGNEATSTTVGGGALYMGGGTTNLTNIILAGNKTAYNGGALYVNSGTTNCLFCTMSGNYAVGKGGGIYHQPNSSTTTVKNSIIYNNGAGNPSDSNYKQIETNLRYQYVDLYNTLINQAPGSGTGNPRYSYEDLGGNLQPAYNPNFVTPIATPSTDTPTTAGDFRIQSGSPAVNAGSASYTSDHDIFGGSRPLGGGYDMGAHEKE